MDAVKFLAALRAAQAGPAVDAQHITPATLVARWAATVPLGTLSNWRTKRRGPPFVKVGARVLYQVAPLLAWEREQLAAAGVQNG